MAAVPRVVLDTNILLRGLASERSDAAKILDAAETRGFTMLLSRPVVAEYRAVLLDPKIRARFPRLTPDHVELTLARLAYLGELVRDIRVRFSLPRDPRDERFLALAIAGAASHIITGDPDLLDLSTGHDDAAKRFRQRAPAVKILDPAAFVRLQRA